MEDDKFTYTEILIARCTKDQVKMVEELKKLYPDKYINDSQVLRAALHKMYRKEVEEKYGKRK